MHYSFTYWIHKKYFIVHSTVTSWLLKRMKTFHWCLKFVKSIRLIILNSGTNSGISLGLSLWLDQLTYSSNFKKERLILINYLKTTLKEDSSHISYNLSIPMEYYQLQMLEEEMLIDNNNNEKDFYIK